MKLSLPYFITSQTRSSFLVSDEAKPLIQAAEEEENISATDSKMGLMDPTCNIIKEEDPDEANRSNLKQVIHKTT